MNLFGGMSKGERARALPNSEQIAAIVQGLGGIAEALQSATAQERAAVYESLAIRLTYDDRTNQVRATSDLARVLGGVGGGPCPPATREVVSIWRRRVPGAEWCRRPSLESPACHSPRR